MENFKKDMEAYTFIREKNEMNNKEIDKTIENNGWFSY